jgi:hypothetical protein
MTLSEINNIADLLTAAGRRNVPVPISEWREYMATKIGKATIKDGKVRPVVKRTVSQKIAGTKKADRVVKGLRKNRAASKARAAK